MGFLLPIIPSSRISELINRISSSPKAWWIPDTGPASLAKRMGSEMGVSFFLLDVFFWGGFFWIFFFGTSWCFLGIFLMFFWSLEGFFPEKLVQFIHIFCSQFTRCSSFCSSHFMNSGGTSRVFFCCSVKKWRVFRVQASCVLFFSVKTSPGRDGRNPKGTLFFTTDIDGTESRVPPFIWTFPIKAFWWHHLSYIDALLPVSPAVSAFST